MNSDTQYNNMNIYRPQSIGTKITDLLKDKKPDNQPTLNYNMSHNNINNYPNSQMNQDTDVDKLRQNKISYDRLQKLAHDVNSSLHALEELESNKNNNDTASDESVYDNVHESEKHVSNKKTTNTNNKTIVLETMELENDYVKLFIEILILLTLYVILSQPFVLRTASGYVRQLNPNEDGVISMTGIIIYGLILTILFIVVRKLVLNCI